MNNLNFRESPQDFSKPHKDKNMYYSIYYTSVKIKNYLHRVTKDILILKYFVKYYTTPTAANI